MVKKKLKTKKKKSGVAERTEVADTETIQIPEIVNVLPLRDTVIFPNTMFPILVGRDSSLNAVNKSNDGDKFILLCTQKNPDDDEAGFDDIYKTGTLAQIVQVLKLPNNLIKVLVSGLLPAAITDELETKPSLVARVNVMGPPVVKNEKVLQSIIRKTRERFEKFIMINPELPEEILLSLEQIETPAQLLYYMASYLELDIADKQKILELNNLEAQFKSILTMLTSELEMLEVSNQINEKVQEEIQESQRKYFIQEQIRALQEELDEDGFADPDLARLKETVEKLALTEQAKTKAYEELERLKKTPQMSPEYSVSRNYIDWLLSLPWGLYSKDNLNIDTVQKELEKHHYGLEKPKDRILEHIAVLNLVKEMKGQILCFVGPPGTGKTSLAKSIADAMGRKMVRISLGGVNDEAEVRGHRKTYIGSMPGRIIQSMKKAGTMNPVIILDEIDKLSHDYRGDPSSAILEVLDPEQNHAFNDHYLELDFDLSKAMFITTANVASNIQAALLDRMEVINLPGYLEYDKLQIARTHMLPKLLKNHGLVPSKNIFSDESILEIIRKYTAEAGVRQLEQQLAAICRKLAKKLVVAKSEGRKSSKTTIRTQQVHDLLGVEKYRDRDLDKRNKIGSVNGLAWTSTGGSILQIDVAAMRGKPKLTLTGQMGDVMKESGQAALSYIRSNAHVFNIPADYFDLHEIHIHIPEGAIPKDGPSAGMAMALAILSIAANRPVKFDVAMTGEITIRGEVYAIGGLNEKLLAAKRNKISKVLIPKDNERDLVEIPDKVKDGLKIISVNTIDEAIPYVFAKK